MEGQTPAETSAGLDETVLDILNQTQKNVALAPKAGNQNPGGSPAGGANPVPAPATKLSPKWAKVPKRYFATKPDGSLVMKGGKPVPKNPSGGRPPKPKPGDILADGSVHGGARPDRPKTAAGPGTGGAGVSGGGGDAGMRGPGIVDPSAPRAPAGGPQPMPPTGCELGPEAGEVFADVCFNTIEATTGRKATDSEKASIRKAAGQTCNGVRLPAVVALLVLVAAVVVRLWLEGAGERAKAKANQKPKEAAKDGSPADRRADDERQKPALQKPFSYGD